MGIIMVSSMVRVSHFLPEKISLPNTGVGNSISMVSEDISVLTDIAAFNVTEVPDEALVVTRTETGWMRNIAVMRQERSRLEYLIG